MIAIEFENISKQYRLGIISTRTLSHDLNRWWAVNILRKEDPYLKIGSVNDRSAAADSDYVWALKDINFKVEQGEVVGIIGRNGAGKSTLLKLLSRVTGPTTGSIKARGRIGSLLEVGTGFHPEMTGRENIYMNGAILGMTKHEIKSKLDEIIDFSGCERYIDTPVKRYSSGMMVRLGFAVAAHLDPEILVVDEVLAVGDAEFQKKAIGKMQDVSKGEGRTVLFVSHNMGSMQQLCKKGILLDKGQIAFMDSINKTVMEYQKAIVKKQLYVTDGLSKEVLHLERAEVLSNDISCFFPSSEITIKMQVRIFGLISCLVVGFNIYSVYGYPIVRSDYNDIDNITTLENGVYEFVFTIPPYTLSNGEYKVVFDVADINVKNFATESSNLYFDVLIDKKHFGNVYNEVNALKTSVCRPKCLVHVEKKSDA
ncbi:ABC transporter ATP-binding protein [Bacteroides heparinolyticus]|uniref:ABC transporter ATP-binding protein n=1 Tax=Prevotella heparinolytica TaxID=28113 RepID=UPI0035A0E3D0